MRIGHGYDVHQLVEGRKLLIGGVDIQHSHGLLGHSDADVLLHAICDALIGAMGLGDIGQHFPDSDKRYAGVDSRELLRSVFALMQKRSYALSNLDCTIVAQSPKLAPYLNSMREHIAQDLECQTNQINVKATTTECLGFTGRKEGIAAHAVVLIQNAKN